MNTIEQFERLNAPAPIPTEISRPFWAANAAKSFFLQKCDDCGSWVFYPRGHCPHCWGGRLNWTQATGRATLESFSVVHRPGHPSWTTVAPYSLGIVRLEEGPTMLSTLVTASQSKLKIDMPLEVCFVTVGQFTLPMFQPALERSSGYES